MPNPPFSWQCPYCGQSTTITSVNFHSKYMEFDVSGSSRSDYTLFAEVTRCPNTECNKTALSARLSENGWVQSSGLKNWLAKEVVGEWNLMPRSSAKPMPEYVPAEVRANYEEACLIQHDSPKASAAMSRRCLQGIVRDFWDIPHAKRGNLGAEISFIRDKVDEDTLESIKAVREVGDIGAHMEKAVDTIVDVEPEEAALLIELIETLVSDWYVAKHRRASRNKLLQETVAAKREAKKVSKETVKQLEHKSEE